MSEPTKTDVKIEDMPEQAEELTPQQAEAAEGGLLPAVHTQNTTQVSNPGAHLQPGVANLGDGSVRPVGGSH